MNTQRRCQSTFLSFQWIICWHKLHFCVSPLVSWITQWSWSALPFQASSYALTGNRQVFCFSVSLWSNCWLHNIYNLWKGRPSGYPLLLLTKWLNRFMFCAVWLLFATLKKIEMIRFTTGGNVVCCHFVFIPQSAHNKMLYKPFLKQLYQLIYNWFIKLHSWLIIH